VLEPRAWHLQFSLQGKHLCSQAQVTSEEDGRSELAEHQLGE
jgi:hypothetical protein